MIFVTPDTYVIDAYVIPGIDIALAQYRRGQLTDERDVIRERLKQKGVVRASSIDQAASRVAEMHARYHATRRLRQN